MCASSNGYVTLLNINGRGAIWHLSLAPLDKKKEPQTVLFDIPVLECRIFRWRHEWLVFRPTVCVLKLPLYVMQCRVLEARSRTVWRIDVKRSKRIVKTLKTKINVKLITKLVNVEYENVTNSMQVRERLQTQHKVIRSIYV